MSIYETYFIQEVMVEDIVNNITTSVDCHNLFWGERDLSSLMEDKFADSPNELIKEISSGNQKYPIVICTQGSIDPDIYEWCIGNGNHRLAIAIAAGIESLMVVFSEDEYDYMLSDVSSGDEY